MKKLGNWIIVFLGVVVTLSLSLLSSVNLSGSSGLNTQKYRKVKNVFLV